MTQSEADAAIAATVAKQAAEDRIGMQAATAALPGPLADVFSPAPDIKVGPFSVRRFVDGDFVALSALGHPLSRFTALADGDYKMEPTGEQCWQLCWLLTRSRADAKEVFRSGGITGAKDQASDIFGDLPVMALGKIMEAIAKQMIIYASAHLAFEANATEGEHSAPKQ